MPGVSAGTMNSDIFSYVRASGLVTAMTIKNDACLALVENHFSPLMIQSPFPAASRVAAVTNSPGSEPPCGSVIE
ncbi:Uncharacterised protein [Mycobacterium tuberculosis]|nr:Uncharacterised protein [Mycobacterium tuberculosis]CNV20570.1 Uncharacterised protein [Mycobacterium tuberculosis]COW37310.1 Uncharacterised protein [Mycobacterium tuberculosis]SGO26200.1 Uncharacterised protein [Mycobacterium tuberculosis]